MVEGSRVRLIDVEWTVNTQADADSLYRRLSAMRGLDENGNNTDQAQVSGTLHATSITKETLDGFNMDFPALDVQYENIVPYTYVTLLDGTISGDYVNSTVGTVRPYAFFGFRGAELRLTFKNAIRVENNAFFYSPAIRRVDLWKAESIGDGWGYSGVTVLIIRTPDKVCTRPSSMGSNVNEFNLYVPSELVNSYKPDENWSSMASRIFAIEDFPEITGGAT